MFDFVNRSIPESPECDADKLILFVYDALNDEQLASFAEIGPGGFNDSGTPQLLYIGRLPEQKVPDVMIIDGREEAKSQLSIKGDKALYKETRSLMMSYKMGEEIPVAAVGSDESIRVTTVPFPKKSKNE